MLIGNVLKQAAGGVLTAQQAPRRPGIAPGHPVCAGVTGVTLRPHTAPAKEDRHVALRRLDDGGFCPTLPDGRSTAAGCPAAAAVAALNQPFAMPDHHSERRGSSSFLVSIRVGMAGVMAGLQGLDERVAKNRRILV